MYALASVLCWSTVATAFKLALSVTDVVTLVFWSTLSSTVFLGVVAMTAARRRELLTLGWRDILPSLLMGLLNPFLYYLVLFRAYDLLPAQEAQPLNYTWPVVLSLLAALLLRKPFRRVDGIAMLLSFCGVLLISTRGEVLQLRFTDVEGVALATGSSLIWASYWILNMRSTIDPALRLALNFLAGSVFIAAFILMTGASVAISTEGLAGAVYIGLFEMGLTFILWMSALRHAENTARVSNLVFLSPFLSLLIIAGVLGESIYPSTILGLSLIIGGILLQQLQRGNRVAG
jgi:drug/metabolite transporter (DMT)-like permease